MAKKIARKKKAPSKRRKASKAAKGPSKKELKQVAYTTIAKAYPELRLSISRTCPGVKELADKCGLSVPQTVNALMHFRALEYTALSTYEWNHNKQKLEPSELAKEVWDELALDRSTFIDEDITLDAALTHTDPGAESQLKQGLIEVNTITLFELINRESSLAVPDFQRDYIWSQQHLKDLKDDLEDSALDGGKYLFLGSVVLLNRGSSARSRKLVLDGQQRLFTYSLIVASFAKNLRLAGYVGVATSLLKLLLTEDPAAAPLPHNWTPKFIPSPADRSQYYFLLEDAMGIERWVPRDGGPRKTSHGLGMRLDIPADLSAANPIDRTDRKSRTLAKKGKVGVQIRNIYDLLVQQHFNQASNGIEVTVKDAGELVKFLRSLFLLPLVGLYEVGEEQDPYDVFERLNYKGEKLKPADLIRTIVLSKFGNDWNAAAKFHNMSWLPFENEFASEAEGGQGYTKSDLDKFYGSYAAMSVPTEPKRRLMETVRKCWNGEPFGPNENGSDQAHLIVIDVQKYGKLWRELVRKYQGHFEEGPLKIPPAICEKIWLLSELDVSENATPYIMKLAASCFGKPENSKAATTANQILDLLLPFFIRHQVSPYEGRGLNVIFRDLCEEFDSLSGSQTPDAVFKRLDKSGDQHLQRLTDSAFQESLGAEQLGKGKTKGAIRCILLAFDFKESAFRLEDKRVDLDLTLEHVLPDSLTKAGERVPGWNHVSTDDHKSHKNLLGNFVLLNSPENVGQDSLPKKAALYITPHNYVVTKAFGDKYRDSSNTDWGSGDILKRTETLIKFAVDRFPFKPEKAKRRLDS